MKLTAESLLNQIKAYKRKVFTPQVLMKKIGVPQKERKLFQKLLRQLAEEGKIFASQNGYCYTKAFGYRAGTMVRVNTTYGFARVDGAEEDVFVPGRMMKGALAGDRVLLREKSSRGALGEAEVISVLERSANRMSGTVVESDRGIAVMPDGDMNLPLTLLPFKMKGAQVGDKVLFTIDSYGKTHHTHKVSVIEVFGQSDKAANCCEAILAANEVYRDFPEEALAQAREVEAAGIRPADLERREDLRALPIFTIDGADTKDIDDAVSLEKTAAGYRLGVHIADVSHYVVHKSPLDEEAFFRGTSVYFADSVVPMLPKELSNGICSLNPGVDRLAFSCFVDISEVGEITGYELKKSVIRSRVKGVYKELNQYLAGEAGPEILEKYQEVLAEIPLMAKLAKILTTRRFGRGAINLESAESKIIVGEDGRAVDIQRRVQGESERMIEEFMLMANQAVATFAIREELPFVFRVHENPPENKIAILKETLDVLGIDNRKLTAKSEPEVMAQILESVRETDKEALVNSLILRAMAKAKYDSQNLGHFGLVLDHYCHFTSPIRRYADLAIHRVLTAYLASGKQEGAVRKYRMFAKDAAQRATDRELVAVSVERSCEDCYKAEYMSQYIGQCFDGVISGAAAHGIYVELENSVEGLVSAARMPDGFVFDGTISFVNGTDRITVGEKLRVKVLSCNIPMGNIDFEIAYGE